MAGPHTRQQRHQLGGLVLQQEVARRRKRGPQRVACGDGEPVGRQARWRGLDTHGTQAFGRELAAAASPIDAKRQRRLDVVERHPRRRRVQPDPVDPARHQPPRMRSNDVQGVDGLVAIVGRVDRRGSGGQHEAIPRARERAQDPVDEAAGAGLAASPHQRHRVVHDGRCRHALEEQQLKHAEPQGLEHDGVECVEAPRGGLLQVEVDPRAPADRADDDGRGQRAVALVGQLIARARERVGQIGASRHARHRVERHPAGRGDHPSTAPGGTACPARNSRAAIARLPSGFTVNSWTVPCPAATTK